MEEVIFQKIFARKDPLFAMIKILYGAGYCPEKFKLVLTSLEEFYPNQSDYKKVENVKQQHAYWAVYPKFIDSEVIAKLEKTWTESSLFIHLFLLRLNQINLPLYSKLIKEMKSFDKLNRFAYSYHQLNALIKNEHDKILMKKIKEEVCLKNFAQNLKKLLKKDPKTTTLFELEKKKFLLFFTF